MVNIPFITKALDQLSISYNYIGTSHNAISMYSKSKQQYFFIGCSSPVCNATYSLICRDKGFTYTLLKNIVNLPKTIHFFDPNGSWEDRLSMKDILKTIEQEFDFPVMIKMNKGTMGKHIYKCDVIEDVENALNNIFTQNRQYDYIALAQEYIHIQREYRVIVYKNKVELVYYKNLENATFQGNISPMYHEGAITIPVKDPIILQEIQSYVDKITKGIQLPYTGIDLAFTAAGEYKLIELNAAPALAKYVRDNGDEEVVNMYKKIIQDLP